MYMFNMINKNFNKIIHIPWLVEMFLFFIDGLYLKCRYIPTRYLCQVRTDD